MGENSRFDFCPKCGALARDGVCQSCGYQDPAIQAYVAAQTQNALPQGTTGQQGYVGQPQGMAGQQFYAGQPQGIAGQQAYAGQQPYAGQPQGMAGQQAYAGQQPYAGQPQGMSGQQPYAGQPQGIAGQQAYAGQPPYAGQPQGIAGQQAYMGQQQVYAGQPQYQNGPVYQGQYPAYAPAVPPAQPAKKGGHKSAVILAVILGVIIIAVVALILLGSYIIQKNADGRNRESGNFSSNQNRTREEEILDEYESEYSEEFSVPEESEVPMPASSYSHYSEDVTRRNWEEEGQDEAYSYYTGPYNALRDDLDYELSFTEETYSSDDGSVYICVEYPQIETGEVANQDYINTALYYEYEYYLNLYKEDFKPLVTREEDTFYCIADSYITYMDEKILSVVFREEIYLELQDDPFAAVNLFCLNFDLETGALLDNTELLRIDEAFAIDFREREVEENGDEALTYYTDQEILEMLSDDSYLVMFYTPMGMEVGLNLDDRVVYVTYADYEEYLNSF